MFSKRMATAQLQMLSEASAQSESGLWIPEYHTLSQIDSFNSHMFSYKVYTKILDLSTKGGFFDGGGFVD